VRRLLIGGGAIDIETLGGYELKSIWPDAAE